MFPTLLGAGERRRSQSVCELASNSRPNKRSNLLDAGWNPASCVFREGAREGLLPVAWMTVFVNSRHDGSAAITTLVSGLQGLM